MRSQLKTIKTHRQRLRALLTGVLCFALTSISGADISNTAAVTYIDAQGSPHSAISNTVVTQLFVGPPTIAVIVPSIVTVGDPALTLTINGNGTFPSDAVVMWPDGTALATTWVNSSELQALVPSTQMLIVGDFNLTVKSTLTGVSNAGVFSVVAFPVAEFHSASYVVPMDGVLPLDKAVGVSFTWTLNATSGAPGIGARSGNFAAAGSASAVTQAPQLGFAGLNLGLGTYALQVVATNAAGKNSAPAHTQVTIISSNFSGARVYPNPVRAARGDTTMTFDQMPNGTAVKIFTVSGRLVKKLDAPGGSATWDLTNDSGEKVASGIYLFVCTDNQGDHFRGKFTVIR